MKLRPKQGQVLVELLPYETETDSGIALPENMKRRDAIGKMPAQKGKVLALGVWATTKKGHLIPYDFAIGDTILVDPTMGQDLDASGHHWKIFDASQVLGMAS